MPEVRNVADLVRRAADTRPDHPALHWHDRVITWAELDRQVDGLAAALAGLGLPADGSHPARVAVALPNVPEFAVALFAALRANLVAVPVNPAYTHRELAHVLGDSGAAVLIGTRDVLAAAGDDAPPHTFALGDLPHGDTPPETTTGGEDLALLIYTSGTSGAPKGAMLSHRALLANHEQLAAIDPPPAGPDDVFFLALPLFHAYGLNSGIVAAAYYAATGVLVERFDPADTLALIARHGITVVAGVPPMYVAWSLMGERLADAFKSVRLAASGTAPLDRATAERFTAASGQPVHEGYGLTETAPVVASTLGSATRKPGSIGRPIPGVEVKLALAGGREVLVDGPLDDDDYADEEYDTDSPGTPGTDPGEVLVRGANLFSGYWPDGREGPRDDGWWHTADVAYADADGDLFLVDRLTELILVSGFNVYPHEVEQVLAAHPAVAEAAVIGVPHPYTGQAVKAFVVRSGEVTATAGLSPTEATTDELIAHAERNLARFKCPATIEFVSELPHSATGKVRKGELR
ncbi:AMP-binding protein [Virgisporangium ochraceum]|uniref:Long-chain acyl-CoA synthetase n=1 Tax=Virgisporangium ochraceum TaxID=65505 RepID=A0A8J4A2A6_9ACTN|nr:AMP-binding protein [Virgisporangium ochraceum]GIJ74419.1 long-chain acyl-CoA synthetase [Virgisporangium ochraceum]